jgi:hypothetical protein
MGKGKHIINKIEKEIGILLEAVITALVIAGGITIIYRQIACGELYTLVNNGVIPPELTVTTYFVVSIIIWVIITIVDRLKRIENNEQCI